MIKRFGFITRYRLLLSVAMVFILFSSSYAVAEQAQFKHQYLTMNLPAGWSVDKAAATDNELIGVLKSATISGSSILIYAYRGAMLNYRNIRIRGLKRIAIDYPKGQKHLKKPKKIKTDSGYKVQVELWQGFIDAGSMIVALQSPMAVMKTKKSYILMIGYTPDVTGAKMEEDFIKILKSAE
jgi:hypothetical protein